MRSQTHTHTHTEAQRHVNSLTDTDREAHTNWRRLPSLCRRQETFGCAHYVYAMLHSRGGWLWTKAMWGRAGSVSGEIVAGIRMGRATERDGEREGEHNKCCPNLNFDGYYHHHCCCCCAYCCTTTTQKPLTNICSSQKQTQRQKTILF